MKRLIATIVAVVALLTLDTACKPDVITQFKTDTVIVQQPGRRDTIIVTRPDTIVVTKPETTLVYLPGKTDTIIDVRYTPPETTIVQRVDTVIVTHYDTTVVVKPETLIVIQHDTVIVHDTITHYDTVRLAREPVYLCIYMTMGDTLAAFNWDTTPYCDAAHLALNVAGTWNTLLNVDTLVMKLPAIQSALTRMANRPPSPLILPGYWTKHR